MFRLETIELIKEIVTNLIAYIPISTLGGFIGAWIALRVGDDTAQNHGLLSLNPLNHIDPIGIALIAIPPHLGFPRNVPINPHNVVGKFKKLKLILLCFSTFIAYTLTLIFTLFILSIVNHKILFTGAYLTAKEIPSLVTVILFIFRSVINLSIFWMLLYLVSGFVSLFIHYFFPNFEDHPKYLFVLIALPILIILVFGSQIETYLRLLLIHIDSAFTYLLT